MIKNLHALRAIAAFMVVFHHLQDSLALYFHLGGKTVAGTAGVDIFFIISGFVMVHTNKDMQRTPMHFWTDRAIRILPLYWIATAVIVGLFFLGFQPGGLTNFTASKLVRSLLLIAYPSTPGSPSPVHFLGWTLVYEVYFYLLFGLLMFLGSIGRVTLAMSGIFLLSLGLFFSPAGQNFYVITYANPILLEFLAGMILALLYNHATVTAQVIHLQPWARLAALLSIMAGLGGILSIEFMGLPVKDMTPALHALHFMLPAILVVGGALLAERANVKLESRFLFLLGSASYAIYLFHPIVLQAAVKIMAAVLDHDSAVWMILAGIAAFAAAGIAGLIIHLYIEAPLQKRFKRWAGLNKSTAKEPGA